MRTCLKIEASVLICLATCYTDILSRLNFCINNLVKSECKGMSLPSQLRSEFHNIASKRWRVVCVKEEMLRSVRAEVLKEVPMNITIFLDMTPCTSFRQKYCFHLQVMYVFRLTAHTHWRSHFLQSKHQTCCVLSLIAPRWKQHVSPKRLCPSTHFSASYSRRQQTWGCCSTVLSLACPPTTFCKQFVCPHFHATPAERGPVLFRGCSPMVKAHCRYQ